MDVPFLGYHLISENDFLRYKDIKYCVTELRKYFPRTCAILVTKEKDVDRLSTLINDIEFAGVQLHYPDSDSQATALRGIFGETFKIFQVISPEDKSFIPTQSDYALIDKSYLGGTGTQITDKAIRNILDQLNGKRVFVAGGISSANLYEYLEYPVDGFDIQSSIKSDHATKYENTDYFKMTTLARLLGYEAKPSSGLVGFAIQDIRQENQELFHEALHGKVDFLHVDMREGFVGTPSDLVKISKILQSINDTNSHLRIQIHLFVASEEKFNEVSQQLNLEKHQKYDIFVHINRDNYENFNKVFVRKQNIFFAADTKDIIDELFPWEQFVKEQMLICLQSKEHKDRIQNLDKGLKLIRYSTNLHPIISIDRNVSPEVILGLENLTPLNAVCGSYLRENISERYQVLKQYLYAKNKP